MKVGIGIDAHRFSRDRKLILGGIEIPYEMGLDGHSDADVLTHAVIDSILGALGKGDIGRIFPDSEERYRGIYSIKLLEKVKDMFSFNIINLDTVIICQKPKLSNYMDSMVEKISRALGIEKCKVSVKATTTEYMGFTGRGEGICAVAIVLLEDMNSNEK
ncbi:MAG: 2-C-methyl-D-erythritol 2,4-cyclodiphosphate synthase [bacterium]|uniref:2-C-methyl-D-erythritol 2,4-cyclodiphosphate synthase n=2 Tax=Bacteria candidate phyla TaxID=1783234 RepID=A0A117M6A7_UNCT6|nr:MAG: 2-C-methyl-D-erythritol 2,4-cyclodiphosphate synthase [candidate division TA06 bacterium 32_111]KUK86756.1 MAG: 2-C-methyl-D-erythritol 2,4-cyclodiphosphate synthase [candidate division TA06 bacterium 34_109]MDI6700274.1 2-C-methyl-D-erythritol 2,4-cyclodiphosphate synthase [bacterium]HAF08292.1 2-C-methyl-D-erythritol 2,4-cyclodiphosphate synthase [candidate division WOR-3 bacterium]HCP16546.1 2-C-methyl-D-erythritol 2,4-cyclodiphosphate synthase [candidate division WOR-3 bacterium]